MTTIDIPTLHKKDTYIGDGQNTDFSLTSSGTPTNINVFVSGIYMTENEDFNIDLDSNTIQFFEVPIEGENINILYEI